MKLLGRLAMWVAVILAAVYLGVGGLLWWLQDAMLFPTPGGIDRASLDGAAREVGARPVDLVASDGVPLYAWHRDAGGRRAVAYFHGNAETVADSMAIQRLAYQRGWDFATVAFRGYPGSGGAPSEEGLIRDARALWDHLIAQGIPPERIVLHGRSLGGGVATALAADVGPGGLVIESSYVSVLEIASSGYPMYPVSWLLRSPLRTDLRASKVHAPTLVLHGDADTIIPVDHGRRLGKLFPEATYVELPGRGHNDPLSTGTREGREAWLALLDRVDPKGIKPAP